MEVVVDQSDLKIERLELSSFATNTYIVICPRTLKSVLIDAPAGAPTILKHLKGTNLEYILLTHNHGDHMEGLKTIRKRNPAPLGIHPLDIARWLPYTPEIQLRDREIIQVGRVMIKCLFTPGHTPGSMCFKIGEYLISGDTIFPGGPGRTIGPNEFKQIVKSITKNIFPLPEDTLIFPGHGSATVLKKEKDEYAVFSARKHDPKLYGDITWLNS
jgi:hydroxyacylglutathione hydrolase